MKLNAPEVVEDFQTSYEYRHALEQNPDATTKDVLELFWKWIAENGYLTVELY